MAASASLHEHMTQIYFGSDKKERFYLDETKEQWIEFKKLNEGERASYQDTVAGETEFNQETKTIKIESKTGTDRSTLARIAVCGYKIFLGNDEWMEEFNSGKWMEIYSKMDGDKAEELINAISKFNGFVKEEQNKKK